MSALVVVCGQQAAGGRLLHTHAHRHPSRLENVRARDPSTIIHAVPCMVRARLHARGVQICTESAEEGAGRAAAAAPRAPIAR